jgi:hypothetical protein
MVIQDLEKKKRTRRNILDLKINYPEEFGRYIMALDAMIKSDDWERICGIHGLSFNPFDKNILCPTNPTIVSKITRIGEPQYCPHGVRHFLIWHTIYLLEFEFILNKYNQSKFSNQFISLPWLNIASIGDDKEGKYNFMSDPNITIQFDSQIITIPNPLIGGKIYLNSRQQKTKRNGYLKTKTKNKTQQNLMEVTTTQLDNSLLITNYESLTSNDIPKKRTTLINTISLETPHGTIHTSVGGSGGSMSSISTAAHDPIFWLHHCNIDRYFYNWMKRITNNFTIKLTEKEILPETLELILAPFFQNQHDLMINDNYIDYKFCFSNDTKSYLKISDSIDLSQYNYEYEPIVLKQKLMWKPHYFELIGIPIPQESSNIKLFIVPKDIDLFNLNDKEQYLAGSACWIGINRNVIHCDRCEKTRTNVSIDITHYLLENSINKKNISKYNLILEADGLGIEKSDGTFKLYTHEEIIADGKYLLILDTDDILLAREFKFESKYIHTRLIQSIIYKLDKLGYHIDDITDWDKIITIKEKFESDWGMDFSDLIKLKITDKLTNTSNDMELGDRIELLKKLFVKSYNNTTDTDTDTDTDNIVKIYYTTKGFDSNYINKINDCINEWVNQFKLKKINVEFIYIDLSKNGMVGMEGMEGMDGMDGMVGIEFNFVPIDGEYGTCGDTCLITDNIIKIDIDSQEDYQKINGLFELIVKHELGHSFGLIHNSNPKSIMHPFVSDLEKKVSQFDIENIIN